MTIKFKEDTCQMNRTSLLSSWLSTGCPCQGETLFFFQVALESSENLSVTSLYHSTIYIKISWYLIIFLVVYGMRPPCPLWNPFFTLKSSTFALFLQNLLCRNDLKLHMLFLPGDSALRRRSKLKTNKTHCFLNIDSGEYFTPGIH